MSTPTDADTSAGSWSTGVTSRLPLTFFIGLRYARSKRRNHFVSFITLTSVVGMALGVAVLILVLSVMNGFEREFRERILGLVPQATLNGYDAIPDWEALRPVIEQHPQVAGLAPYVQGQAMLMHGSEVSGVLVNGILPAQESQVSIVAGKMVEGELTTLSGGGFGMVLGQKLADKLGARPGDKVTMILPEATASLAGIFPRLKRFEVTGIFATGSELDEGYTYIHIEDAAKLYRLNGGVQGVRLKLHDVFAAYETVWQLINQLPNGYWGSDWTRSYGNLFQAIQLSKSMNGLILILIVAVAAFNIVSTLVMVVTDKRASIAILRTMGASSRQVMAVFMVQGSVIGLLGTGLGLLLGSLLAAATGDIIAWIETAFSIQFLNSDVYFITDVPSQLLVADLVTIASVSLLLSFLATLYPSWRASRVRPAQALRYE